MRFVFCCLLVPVTWFGLSAGETAVKQDARGPLPRITAVTAPRSRGHFFGIVGQQFRMLVDTVDVASVQVVDWEEGDSPEGTGAGQYQVGRLQGGGYVLQWTFAEPGRHWVHLLLTSARGRQWHEFKRVDVFSP